MANQWYYIRNGKQKGPVSWDQLQRLAAGGVVASSAMIWAEGMSSWVPASTVAGLLPAGASIVPPAMPYATAPSPANAAPPGNPGSCPSPVIDCWSGPVGPRRTVGMTAIAMINFAIAAIQIILGSRILSAVPILASRGRLSGPDVTAYMSLAAVMIVDGILGTIAGLGLLNLSSWARGASYFYAACFILWRAADIYVTMNFPLQYQPASDYVWSDLGMMIYPGIILLLLNTDLWRRTLGGAEN